MMHDISEITIPGLRGHVPAANAWPLAHAINEDLKYGCKPNVIEGSPNSIEGYHMDLLS